MAVEMDDLEKEFSLLMENIDEDIEIVIENEDEIIGITEEELNEIFSKEFEFEEIINELPSLADHHHQVQEAPPPPAGKKSSKRKEKQNSSLKLICEKCKTKYVRPSAFKKHREKCLSEGVVVIEKGKYT